MRKSWRRRALGLVATALLIVSVVWFAWPQPVPVDLAEAALGPMEVAVEDEAKTRIRHIYTVSAPLAGRVLRISSPHDAQAFSIHVGDQVTANETVVAVMQPTPPGFIDARSREELQAAVAAADAAVALADAEVRRIEAALDFARSELRRAEALARTDVIAARALDRARFDAAANEAAFASAKAQLEMRRSERASAAARLIEPAPAPQSNPACCIQLRAPVSGRVLKINQDSEAAVPAGTPLVEIGDLLDLEVVADLLSTDAVQIAADAQVRIDGWGGAPVRGRVTRVDPAGFVKVSALGIEEQRVRTIINFADPPETWSRLGHEFRVIVQITVWSSEKALTVPVGALFRQGDDWAVFAVRGNRSRLSRVRIGHRNGRQAEVLSGLSPGELVVLHPSDRVGDGTSVAQRLVK